MSRGNLAFLMAGIPETERVAQQRELRVLALRSRNASERRAVACGSCPPEE